MLYDKRWDKQTKSDPFALENFIAWLETMPPKKHYHYIRFEECAVAQYLKASGVEKYGLSSQEVEALGWADIVNPGIGSHTFGAALTRARAALPLSQRGET